MAADMHAPIGAKSCTINAIEKIGRKIRSSRRI